MALKEHSKICATSICMYYLCSAVDMPAVLQTNKDTAPFLRQLLSKSKGGEQSLTHTAVK